MDKWYLSNFVTSVWLTAVIVAVVAAMIACFWIAPWLLAVVAVVALNGYIYYLLNDWTSR
ncbi:MAG TPA: hypothetical protein VLA89_08130 [Gemmatimonadales bacterium]|nr:hypothetical protein [Gemmatimonadales bacterium]